MEWYINDLDMGRAYTRQAVEDKPDELLVSELKDAKSIAKSFKRLVETPLGTSLHWGFVTEDSELVRTKCSVSRSPRGAVRLVQIC